MKSFITVLVISTFLALNLNAQDKSMDYKKFHYLSAEEMNKPLIPLFDFIETEPPMPKVRNVAEFDHMQAVLVRYPFGIPVNLVAEMSEATEVITLVANSNEQSTVEGIYISNGVNMDNTSFIMAPTDSYWVRDYGPWFVFDGDNNPGIMDFPYNRPRPGDDNVPVVVAQYLDIDLYGMSVYHTGGNYMCDGMGQAASTDLVYEENTQLTEEELASKFSDYLGVTDYQLRPDPLDDYIKHIDCWGKYLSPGKVIVGQVPSSDYRFQLFEEAADYFANKTSSYGKPYEVVRVFTPGTSPNTPYTNSLILNKKVFVPLTGSQWDDEAIATYEEAMPGYEIVGIIYNGWLNTDALHCRTKGVADIGMLYIDHIPLLGNVAYQENYEVICKINVNSGQPIYSDSIFINFKINEDDWQQTNMSYEGNENWAGIISGVMPGDEIDYYIYAADWSGRQSTHPYIGEPDPHEFKPFGASINKLEMNPDTLLFLDYDDMWNGKLLNITNISSDTVKINDITEYGENFMWYVETMPELPYFLPADDTLKLNILCDMPVSFVGEMVSDTMLISTLGKTYKQLLMIDEGLISTVNDKSHEPFKVYPNPFSTQLNFSFYSPSEEIMELKIYNYNGQLVYENTANCSEGYNEIKWDGNSNTSSYLTEGIYYYQLNHGSEIVNGKVVLLR